MREQRRLAAIVSADVAGYSRLMGRDESGTLAALKALRREVVDPPIAAYGGRIVKTTGDGLLLEFPSVVDAVRCVIEVQTAMAERSAAMPEDRRIAFRIGVNLGDIIIDGDDIFGDGVNIAARLQEIAPPSGVCVSSRVHDDVRDRLEMVFEDGGAQTLKNIARPVRVWRWSPGVSAPATFAAVTSSDPPLALPDKPSIAVLPFQNMSDDPEHEYFAEGMVEDIITELSRFRGLFVTARNSSFTYKGKAVDIRQVGRELGVRYVVEGSIRRVANRIRITAQLIDASTGNHVWAERYDRVIEDIFAVQEDVTRSIVAATAAGVEETEFASATRRRAEHSGAMELAYRAVAEGRHAYRHSDAAAFDRSLAFAEGALVVDPACVRALLAAAYVHWGRAHLRLATPPETSLATAMDITERAIKLDWRSDAGYLQRGLIYVTAERPEEAVAALTQAHEFNPNDVDTLAALGWAEVLVGDAQRGTVRLLDSIRRNPKDRNIAFRYGPLALAAFVAGDYRVGVDWASRMKMSTPGSVTAANLLALNYVGAGDLQLAQIEIETMRRLSPQYLADRLDGLSILRRPRDRERAVVFLRVAAGIEDPSAAEALR